MSRVNIVNKPFFWGGICFVNGGIYYRNNNNFFFFLYKEGIYRHIFSIRKNYDSVLQFVMSLGYLVGGAGVRTSAEAVEVGMGLAFTDKCWII